ncbi:hypothetical protein Hanom_Chr10g00920301 [Helianthus anomalus]
MVTRPVTAIVTWVKANLSHTVSGFQKLNKNIQLKVNNTNNKLSNANMFSTPLPHFRKYYSIQ